MANTIGKIFKVTTFGESHNVAYGVVIDGCPAKLKLSISELQKYVDKRKPAQTSFATQRKEKDIVECLSGLQNGITLGAPLTFIVYNKDQKQSDYSDIANIYRPSHADYTTEIKYGVTSLSGGGRASARETISRVIAGGVAKQVLKQLIPKLQITAFVQAINEISFVPKNPQKITDKQIEASEVRCPDAKTTEKILNLIQATQKKGDSLGGLIFCGISNCPAGLGGPVFDKLNAELAKAIMSIPATKGIEFGEGFEAAKMFGSEHNDEFCIVNKKISTKTNRSGGIQGGISNGQYIYFRVAFKPTPTINIEQQTVTKNKKQVSFKPKKGRHDICFVPRAVPVVESMAAITILDHYLRQG